jgi:myo-inositol 2-dehydrogenase/D-chiro-inositol 1-dehydrogenase
MIKGENQSPHTIWSYDREGAHGPEPMNFFMDRYEQSYFHQIKAFIEAISENKPVPVGAKDAYHATAIALAASESLSQGQPVSLYS